MFLVLICTTLWGLFWVQFVIGVIYNLPALYTLSAGKWYFPAIDFYFNHGGLFPWSLAGTFVVFSVFASVLGLIGSWLWTIGVYGKWRMRFAILIFSIILSGWSISALKAENGAWTRVQYRIDRARMEWRKSADMGDEWGIHFYRMEVESLEALLESRYDQ